MRPPPPCQSRSACPHPSRPLRAHCLRKCADHLDQTHSRNLDKKTMQCVYNAKRSKTSRPSVLMRLTTPRHELIRGSTRDNSETTVATDARAAFAAKPTDGAGHICIDGSICLPSYPATEPTQKVATHESTPCLQRCSLAAQCLAGPWGCSADVHLEILVSGLIFFERAPLSLTCPRFLLPSFANTLID